MRIAKSFQLALNILIHSKLRSWLTIIGIVIGVAAMVAIVSIGEGAQANVQARLGGLGADLVTVSPGGGRAQGGFGHGGPGDSGGGGGAVRASSSKNLTILDVQVIKAVEGVSFVNGMVSGRVTTSYLTETASISVQGVDPQAWRNMVTTELNSGRYLNPGDANVVVLGNTLATTTYKQPIALNRMITIGNRPFKVVGILKQSGSFGGDDRTIFMPIAQAREVITDAGVTKLDSIVVKVSDVNLVDQVSADIDFKLMLSRHVTNKTKDYSVTSAKATQERIASVTQTFTIFLGAIAAVSLLVGAVGIANTMFTSVLEKTREIGIMKAIGAKNKDIMMIFLLNAALVGLVGGVIGILIGASISSVLPNLIGMGLAPGGRLTTVIPISLLVEALSVSVLIGMIAGAIPAYRASRLKPVDALRYQ